MLAREQERGTWSVAYAGRPWLMEELAPSGGTWVLDVREFASRGRHSDAADRRLGSVTLRCGPETVELPAVACLAPERHYTGWATATMRPGTRVFVDASTLAPAGSRGTTEEPCTLELQIAYGEDEDVAKAGVLVRAELQGWVDYEHVEAGRGRGAP